MAERSKAPDSSLSFGVDHHTEHSGLARGGGSNPPLVSFLFLFLLFVAQLSVVVEKGTMGVDSLMVMVMVMVMVMGGESV
jgi:hypothetical protein